MRSYAKTIKLFALTLTIVSCTAAGRKSGLDFVSGSVGTWITTSDNTTSGTGKDSYFTTAKVSAYYHVGSFKGYVGLPAQLALEKYSNLLKYAFYPSDFSTYIGKRVGNIEPRLGISIPLWYPTDADIAWTGSGNVKGIIGVGFGLGTFGPKRISVGGECMAKINLTGLKWEDDPVSGTRKEVSYARIDRWSTGWYLSVKASMPVTKKLKAGFELFPHGSYFTTTDWNEKNISSFGMLPVLFVGYAPSSRVELSAKGGYGASSSGSRIIHAVVSATVYTW